MSWQILICLAGLSVASNAIAVPSSHTIHESREEVSDRWINHGRVSADAILPVRVGLTQNNLDKGAEYLMSVSDPASPDYGKHWTSEQVIEAFKPSDESINAVKKWLNDAGIFNVSLSDNKGWLAFNRPASKVESLLYTEFHHYEDSYTGRAFASCDYYYVPKEIQHHIDYITPGLKLLAPNNPIKKAARRQSIEARASKVEERSIDPDANFGLGTCDELMTPACIAALYKVPPSTLTPNPENVLALYESEAQRWDELDLDIFFRNYTNFTIPRGTTPIKISIDGGNSQPVKTWTNEDDGGEIMLDLDIAYPLVYPQSIAIWDENDYHVQHADYHNDTTTFGFNQILDAIDGSYCTYSAYGETGDDPNLDPQYPDPEPDGRGYNHPLQCGVYKPPKVLSSSYGGQENIVPIAYMRRQCNEFMKIGLQGTSVFFASGDSGVGWVPKWAGGETSTGCLGAKNLTFNPAWPNSCPWLTNVGATEIFPPNNVSEAQPESAVYVSFGRPELAFASGGGFSNVYPMPEYQKAAVNEYFTKHNPPYPYYSQLAAVAPNPAMVNVTQLQGNNTETIYNRIGRGYPDVAANGWVSPVVIHGKMHPEGGTSQAAPLFASIINRIVEERLAAGKSSLGFVNTALYAHPEILNDIKNGSNPGCHSDGFKTAPGWDPASGLGTPDYPKMLAFFMSLP